MTPTNALKSIYRRVVGPVPRPSRLNYAHDGLFTVHNADFDLDDRFRRAYRAGKATGSWGDADLEWRVHVCLWLATQATRLDGDFVECGTNRGGTATAMLTYLDDDKRFTDKRLYCFDTFEGLASDRSSEAEMRQFEGKYKECYDEVSRHFEAFPQVRLIRGTIPETLEGFECDRVAFLHVDMNSAEPELAALEFFWPRLTSGAPVLLDDFAWQACGDQRRVIIEFARTHSVEILWLPTGQGVLQKP